MQAFHGDPTIKARYLDRLQQERTAGAIRQRRDTESDTEIWMLGQGSAVGCTIQANDYTLYESQLGIPTALAYLEDCLFQGLPKKQAMRWPEAFLSTIRVRADLARVGDQFLVWTLVDAEMGVIHLASNIAVKTLIQETAALYQRQLAGESIAQETWNAVRNTAYTLIYRLPRPPMGDLSANRAAAAVAFSATDAQVTAIQNAARAVADAATQAAQAWGDAVIVRDGSLDYRGILKGGSVPYGKRINYPRVYEAIRAHYRHMSIEILALLRAV